MIMTVIAVGVRIDRYGNDEDRNDIGDDDGTK